MENYFQLIASSHVYDVYFQGVNYDVQVCREEIVNIYKEDGTDLTLEEVEGVRDYVYENVIK